MADSSPPKGKTSVEGSSSSTGTSQKANTKLFGPNDKINVTNDLSPSPAGQVSSATGTSQKMNVEFKKISIDDDACPCTVGKLSSSNGASQKANVDLFGSNKKINVADDVNPSPAGQVPSSTGTNKKLLGRNKKINVSDDGSFSADGKMLGQTNLKIFSFRELKVATRNFRGDTVLGVGGFGTVYKGWLGDKATAEVVAVKKLNSESMQGFQEWPVLTTELFSPPLLCST
ncbi:hypothetical protein SASPL_126186 [Salvia splendens]|uniref:Protein kinase domain-containing protein n=1 Tax=Salvia splendens TaxID=180675 RepID=A0A8X8ZQR0_SALSN|nr:hypothetical protein SASPL_126186 [Salvia splendens]